MAYWLLFFALAGLVLAYFRAGIRTTSLVLAAATLFFGFFGGAWQIFLLLALLCTVVLVPLNLTVLRQEWLSRPLFANFKRALSRLDEDQLAVIAVGGSGWEAELFGGYADWQRFHVDYSSRLTPDERALLSGPVAEFCARFARDPATPTATARMRAYGLYGFGISSAHGGTEISALAQAAAFGWLSAGVGSEIALRPGNTARLGWIELIKRHGSAAQQSRWLPRLATGAICQGSLTDVAGSAEIDSSAEGLVLKLASNVIVDADAELLGLCVDISDPHRKLPQGERCGLSYLLIEAELLRAAVGRQLLQLDFESLIGGRERLGAAASDGAECRAVADAVTPAAIHAGAVTALALGASSAGKLRTPFGLGGSETALAQGALATLAAQAYAAQALAAATARSVDLGGVPLAPAAFARTLALQQARRCAAAAEDLGLHRSCLSKAVMALDAVGHDAAEPPQLARSQSYSIAVLRSHRAFVESLAAANLANPAEALERFDGALWSHIGHLFSSSAQALVLGLIDRSTLFADRAPEHLYQRRINRYSAALAFCGDVSLSLLGAELASRKPLTALRAVREVSRRSLTTWLGDALAQLYLASAALRQFDQGGANPAERAVLELICTEAFSAVEEALDRLLRHLSSPTLAWLTRWIVMPLGRSRRAASEATQRAAVSQLQGDSMLRTRLSTRSGLPTDAAHWPLLDTALAAMRGNEALEQRAAAATQAKPNRHVPSRIAQAQAGGAIDADEARQLHRWYEAVCAARQCQLPVV